MRGFGDAAVRFVCSERVFKASALPHIDEPKASDVGAGPGSGRRLKS